MLGNLGTAYADSGRTENALLIAAPRVRGRTRAARCLVQSRQAVRCAGARRRRRQGIRARRSRSRRVIFPRASRTRTRWRRSAAPTKPPPNTARRSRRNRARCRRGSASPISRPCGSTRTSRLRSNACTPIRRLSDSDRAVAGFALGKVLEDEGRHAEAFTVLSTANAARRRTSPWDATAVLASGRRDRKPRSRRKRSPAPAIPRSAIR